MTNQLPAQSSKYDQSGQIIYGPQYNAAHDLTIQAAPLEPTRAIPPSPPPDFVGRTEQIAQLAATLAAGRSAAITALQGMGGIGKTALAQQLANQLTSHFSGGIFWAALADHNGNAEPILRTWGAFCGADLSQEPDPNGLADRVRGLLHQRRATQGALLAILDDVRVEWLNAAHLLQHSLPAGVPLLLTLRDVDLATALNAEVVRLDVLPEGDAHKLLTARVNPKELLTPDEAIKALLQQLGYLPLAIRLAGGYLTKFARKPGFTLTAFVADIAQRALTLLDANGGSGLAATFAISYVALTAEQQRIFRYCSVYSPALLTVEHMSGLLSLESSTVEAALDELVTISLLDWDQSVPGHYILHPLLRQYGYDRLSKMEHLPAVHRSAAEWLQVMSDAHSTTPTEKLEEIDQWEKATAWERMARRTRTLVGSLEHVGYWDELEDRLARAQRTLNAANLDTKAHTNLMAALWDDRGRIAHKQALWQKAINCYEQSLALLEQVDSTHRVAITLGNLGLVYQAKGNWDKAIKYYGQSLLIKAQIGDIHGWAKTSNNLGEIYRLKGEWDKAITCYKQSLAIFEQTGYIHRRGQIINNLGLVYAANHDWGRAIEYYQEALQTFPKVGDVLGLAQTTNNLALAYTAQNQLEKAIDLYEQSIEMYKQLGDIYGVAQTIGNLGVAYARKGAWDKAIDLYNQSLTTKAQLGDPHGIAATYANLGIIYNDRQDQAQAVYYTARAYLLFAQLGAAETEHIGSLLERFLGSPAAVQTYLEHIASEQTR